MTGFTITQAALHAALRRVRDDGTYGSLDTLLTLLDPAHQAPPEKGAAAPAEREAPSATTVVARRQVSEAGTPAPPTIELPAGPGEVAPAASETPAVTRAETARQAPSVDQAAEGPPPATTTPGKWTPERIALLTEHLPTCTDRPALLSLVNERPGLPIASVKAMMVKARDLDIEIEAWVPRAIETAAGARGGRSTETGTPTKTSDVRTAERFAAFPALWMDPALSVPEIHARMNAMPGAPVKTSTQLYGWAKKAGLPTQRPLPPADFEDDSDEGAAAAEDDAPPEAAAPPPEPPRREIPRGNSQFRGASLPAVPDEKAEVFDAFTVGQTVRDVAADFGLPLSTLSTWHAEWKLAQRQKDAAA